MIAIIDGDIIAYNSCKNRYTMDGYVVNKYDIHGHNIPSKFSDDEDALYLEQSWENFQTAYKELLERVYCTEALMAVKGPNNFRNALYPDYKMNRHADIKLQNKFVPALRKLAVHTDLAVESTGREADDLIRIWAEQARLAGQDYIICSVDKDLKCIPGKHYLMHKDVIITVSELEAKRFYYEQLLKGDPTDNIPGVPRIGEVKARKLLEPANTEEEFQEIVVSAYISAYQDDWHDYLLSNGKMIYLQKSEDDYFSTHDWPIVKELL